jgi:hypothetical protein
MGRRSNIAISLTHEHDISRWPPPQALALGLVFASVFGGCLQPAAAALSCGAQPEALPVDVTEQIKRDASLILQAGASVNLRGLVTAKRRELRQKNANVDASLLDRQLLWVVCQTISADPELVQSQKLDNYSTVYRPMTEPIAQAAHPAE